MARRPVVRASLAREHALMLRFGNETGLNAIGAWWVYQTWKKQQRKKKR